MPFKKKYETAEERDAVQKANVAKWEAANKEKRKKYHQERYLANKAAIIAKQRAWQLANKDKILSYSRAWSKRNPGYCAEKQRRRVARQNNQTCTCCSRKQIVEFYAACPKGHDVDHITPLIHNGPHCMKNLRYLESSLNRKLGSSLRAMV